MYWFHVHVFILVCNKYMVRTGIKTKGQDWSQLSISPLMYILISGRKVFVPQSLSRTNICAWNISASQPQGRNTTDDHWDHSRCPRSRNTNSSNNIVSACNISESQEKSTSHDSRSNGFSKHQLQHAGINARIGICWFRRSRNFSKKHLSTGKELPRLKMLETARSAILIIITSSQIQSFNVDGSANNWMYDIIRHIRWIRLFGQALSVDVTFQLKNENHTVENKKGAPKWLCPAFVVTISHVSWKMKWNGLDIENREKTLETSKLYQTNKTSTSVIK